MESSEAECTPCGAHPAVDSGGTRREKWGDPLCAQQGTGPWVEGPFCSLGARRVKRVYVRLWTGAGPRWGLSPLQVCSQGVFGVGCGSPERGTVGAGAGGV